MKEKKIYILTPGPANHEEFIKCLRDGMKNLEVRKILDNWLKANQGKPVVDDQSKINYAAFVPGGKKTKKKLLAKMLKRQSKLINNFLETLMRALKEKQ